MRILRSLLPFVIALIISACGHEFVLVTPTASYTPVTTEAVVPTIEATVPVTVTFTDIPEMTSEVTPESEID